MNHPGEYIPTYNQWEICNFTTRHVTAVNITIVQSGLDDGLAVGAVEIKDIKGDEHRPQRERTIPTSSARSRIGVMLGGRSGGESSAALRSWLCPYYIRW